MDGAIVSVAGGRGQIPVDEPLEVQAEFGGGKSAGMIEEVIEPEGIGIQGVRGFLLDNAVGQVFFYKFLERTGVWKRSCPSVTNAGRTGV
jgi:hypothetical protein